MATQSWNDVRTRRLSKPAAEAGYDRARRAFELAERVRTMREARGVSQAELARRIGSTQPAMARLEAGGAVPTIDTLERIAAALELELVVNFAPGRQRSGRRRPAHTAAQP